jgi:EVE domain
MTARNYWIGVVSQDHVALGVAGGFVQLNHGKVGPLDRMRPGDGFAFYSPRTSYPDGKPVQAFTAIGQVLAMGITTVPGPDGSTVHRRPVQFLQAQPAPVKPLIEALDFIRSKRHWGAAFRFGFVRVGPEDFARIAAAMGRDFAIDFAMPAPG